MEKLLKLSEVMKGVGQENAGAYLRAFREAARSGAVSAVETAERVTLKGKKGKAREISEFAIKPDTNWEKWHEQARESAITHSRGVPSFDDLESGAVSFEDAQRSTQERLNKVAQRAEKAKERARRKAQANAAEKA